MPFLLKIDKAKWLTTPWLGAVDVTGDALGDLRTKANELSVWSVLDDASNLDRIVAALAATRDYADKLDYALLADDCTQALQLQVKPTPGHSGDEEANAKWHRDLIELSGTTLLELARTVMWKCERTRVPVRRVKELLKAGVEARTLSQASMKETLQTGL